MHLLTVTETVAAPAARVFERATDIRSWQDTIDAIDRIEMLAEGPAGVGTRFRETRTMMGKEAREEMEVTAFEPPAPGRSRHGRTACTT